MNQILWLDMNSLAFVHIAMASLELTQPLILLFFLLFSIRGKSQITTDEQKSPVSALFAFGDSTVDTGRFTNGKVIPDFLASYLGIKEELPPYFDWSLGEEELITGVSFGSAGSGLDPLTAKISAVIPVLDQLDYFRNYIDRLDQMIGMNKREDIISRAVFVLSAGTNDFFAYTTVPLRGEVFSVEGYQGFLLEKVKEFIQGLSNLRAKRIVVSGLPPMGCLPIVITLNARDGIHERGCIDSFNSIALEYNRKLQANLQEYSNSSGVLIFYADPYKPLLDIIQSPTSYGFKKSTEGCCGTGLVEAALLCNPKSLVCLDASKYIFWDSIHPTEKAYFITFSSFKPELERILKSYN